MGETVSRKCESHISMAADAQESSSETSAKTLQQSETRSKKNSERPDNIFRSLPKRVSAVPPNLARSIRQVRVPCTGKIFQRADAEQVQKPVCRRKFGFAGAILEFGYDQVSPLQLFEHSAAGFAASLF